jgi:hypothetical protein
MVVNLGLISKDVRLGRCILGVFEDVEINLVEKGLKLVFIHADAILLQALCPILILLNPHKDQRGVGLSSSGYNRFSKSRYIGGGEVLGVR